MEIKRWRGLRNTTSLERLRPGELSVAQNVDVDDSFRLLTRLGTSQVLAGSYHSLWADGDMCLMGAASGDLLRVNADYTTTTLGRLSGQRVSYSRQLNTVYLSDGIYAKRIENGALLNWSVPPPEAQPVAAATGGNLAPGDYQYALTFRRANGRESGTGVAGVVSLPTQGGVAFSSIEVSADPEVVDKCLYLSGPDGEELFRLAVLKNSDTSFNYYGSGAELTVRLETQFDNPPPPGDIVECYNGVMYVVAQDIAWHSKPYNFEAFCYRDQWLRFPGQVAMFAAVNDGIYVATDSVTWFLAGDGPGQFKSRVVFDYGAIPMAFTKTTLGAIKSKEEAGEGSPSGTAVLWATPRGVCFGMEGGQAINMTETEYSLPSAQRGALVVRQARGYNQLLAALEGVETPAADAA